MNMEEGKPIIFADGMSSKHRQNTYVQNIILKALTEGVTDPKELRKIAGLGKVADVFRTLDKLALRKEYQAALAMNGIDLGFIVSNFKKLYESDGSSDTTKLKVLQTLLKSLGLDTYNKEEEGGKSWEELIVQASEHELENPGETKQLESGKQEYEVVIPDVPKEEKEKHEEETRLGRELYGE